LKYYVVQGDLLEVYDPSGLLEYSTNQFKSIESVQAYTIGSKEAYAVFHENGMTLCSSDQMILVQDVPTHVPITLYYSNTNHKGYFYYSEKNQLKKSVFTFE